MAETTLTYRIWQDDMVWHWQLISPLDGVMASGVAPTSSHARSAAFDACLKHQRDESNLN